MDIASVKERFLKYVDKTSSTSGCWLWTGHTGGSTARYGYFSFVRAEVGLPTESPTYCG